MLQALRQGLVRNWIRVLTYLILGAILFGLGYWQGQQSSRQQIKVLIDEAVRSSRLPGSAWARANGIRPTLPPVSSSSTNTTPEMKEFLQNRAILMQKMAELRQHNLNGAPSPQILAQFREQNKALLDRQQQLTQIIDQQQPQKPLLPPPLQIPSYASPQMKAYLTGRDQFIREEIAFMNQHQTDDPTTRQTAIQQWRQQNAARFQQLQQEAQALTQTTPTNTTATTTTR